MKWLLRMIDYVDLQMVKAARFLAAVAVAVFTLITFIQVIGRNILRIPMIWSIDVSTLMFTWCVFIGSAMGIYYRSHYIVELFPERFQLLNTLLDLLADVLGGVYFGLLLYYGSKYTELGVKRVSDSLGITMNWFYIVIPISAVFMLWFNLRSILHDVDRLIEIIQGKSLPEKPGGSSDE